MKTYQRTLPPTRIQMRKAKHEVKGLITKLGKKHIITTTKACYMAGIPNRNIINETLKYFHRQGKLIPRGSAYSRAPSPRIHKPRYRNL